MTEGGAAAAEEAIEENERMEDVGEGGPALSSSASALSWGGRREPVRNASDSADVASPIPIGSNNGLVESSGSSPCIARRAFRISDARCDSESCRCSGSIGGASGLEGSGGLSAGGGIETGMLRSRDS